ncbi:MAG: hypothetical protein KJ579_07425 [Verrucomicrobia bacterium]|nr:hypothetical protein [Verrucomicrobiota bacterium]
MKSKVRLLSLVVSFTLILLTIGAVLVVLGIFNAALNWDIFGPKLEAFLYGVFGSCMALAGFGVAMAVIISMQESVRDFKKFVQSRTNQEEIPDAPKKTYAARMLGVVAMMAVLVGLCSLIHHVVLTQRCKVFKRLAAEHIGNFQPRIVSLLGAFASPPQNNVPRDLYDVVNTLDNLDFIDRTTLYIADPSEPAAMWGYTAWRDYTNADGFARFFVAKDFEKAMRKAVDGATADLDRMNDRNEFIWYTVLSRADGKANAVIRIDGNSRQSFREYRFGE